MGPSEDRRLRRALLELYESANLSEVADRILEAVRLLVPGDVLAVTEIDYRTGRIGGRSLPAPEDCLVGFKTVAESYEVLERHFQEHPIVMGFRRTRSISAQRISDHLSAPAFHETALYREFYRKLRVEDQLVFMVPTDADAAAGVAISRGQRSFRSAHIERMNRFAPHVAQAYRNAQRITLLEQSRQLSVESAGAATEALGLRRREGEVLQVIASGCSNAEAAALLGVSPFTIKKHLENIYATLGVTSRSAAVAQLLRKMGLGTLIRSTSSR